MNNDEFAFFNQQLAAMLRDGIPLEAALRRLCADMGRGSLRSELEKVEAALAEGIPLNQALAARKLPDLYRQMLEVGAQSNNLPAVLAMLADHFRRRHLVLMKLKGLMVYPAMVLLGVFALACFLSILVRNLIWAIGAPVVLPNMLAAVWMGPVLLGVVVAACLFAALVPAFGQWLRWRVPAFREASLAQAASALALMLKNGVPLDKAVALMERMEAGTPAAAEFARWRQRMASGMAKFSDISGGGKLFPPLFIWTVSQGQEDLGAGFQNAADFYQSRAAHRAEMLLYSALPCSVLALGVVIMSEIQPVLALFVGMMNWLNQVGG